MNKRNEKHTTTPHPEEEIPELRVGSMGLRTGPLIPVKLFPDAQNSSTFVVPMIFAPKKVIALEWIN